MNRHNGLRMNTAQDVTDSAYKHMYGLISYVQTDLDKVKGLLIKIKVIKGFSAKLKVLKDCYQIKGFKGSTRGAADTIPWPGYPLPCKKTHRRLSTCETTMRVQFVNERRRYATMVKIRHGLAT